jgi:hypothetical protein
MAPDVRTTEDFIRASKGMVYTFDEAIEFMKVLDTLPGGSQQNIQWVRVGTNSPVTIGYSGSNTPQKKKDKSSPIPQNYYKKNNK